jgi:hypothetical protein
MGPLIVASSTRASFCRTPRAPGAVPLSQASAVGAGRPGRKARETDGRGDRRAAVPGPVCGIDIGKAQIAATIRVPSETNPARQASETCEFATTKRGVLVLADWLRCWQVPAVVMESTGGIRGHRPAVCHGR